MKTYQKRIFVFGLWIISMAISFGAGMFLIHKCYIYGDPVSAVTTHIDVDPPVDGPLYGVDDFVRANDAVKDYLSEQKKRPEFNTLQPRLIAVPEMSGYTVYASSGLRGTSFPDSLYKASMAVLKKSLGEIKAKPFPPDAQ